MAGNLSAASAALAVTIDTTAPAAPSAPDLVAASDSGVSNTDNITNVTKPTFTGTAEAGSTVTLYDGTTAVGTGVATRPGLWTITTSTLANGIRSITAKATDVAGNVSAASAALSVTIDTTAPAAPTTLDLATASDTGVSTTDNITNVTTPTFTGKAEAGSTVTLLDGTTVIGTGVATRRGVDHRLLDPGGRNPQHHRQGDGCGRQRQRRVERTVGHRRHRGADHSGVHRHQRERQQPDAHRHRRRQHHGGSTQWDDPARHDHGGTGGTWSLKFCQFVLACERSPRSDRMRQATRATTSGSVLVGTSGANTLTSTAGNDLLYRRRRRGHLLVRFALRARRDRRLCGYRHSSRHHQLPRELGAEQLRKRAEPRRAGRLGRRDHPGRRQHADAQ